MLRGQSGGRQDSPLESSTRDVLTSQSCKVHRPVLAPQTRPHPPAPGSQLPPSSTPPEPGPLCPRVKTPRAEF